MKKNAAAKLEDERFVNDLASLLIPTGMPPIAVRIYGHALLRKEPASLDQIVDELGVSKSSASVAARLLERYGILRRLTESGTKRVRYAISGRCDGFIAEQIALFDSMGRLLKARAKAHPRDEASVRLDDLGSFYLRLRDALDEVYSDPDAGAAVAC